MTSTATRPPRPARAGAASGLVPARPGDLEALLTAGGRAGVRAALLGLLLLVLPVVVVWWGEDRSGTDVLDALRSTAQIWLVAHGVVLEHPGGRLGLAPLGLSAVMAWLCWRAGARAAQAGGAATARAALQAAAGAALLYGGTAVVVAAAVSGAGPTPVLWTAVVGPVLLAGSAAAGGALCSLPPGQGRRLSPRTVGVVCTGTGAALLLLAAGALLVAGSLALDGRAVADVHAATEPGAVGGLGLALLGVALAPNAAVWAVSWLAGPGFAVGAGTAVGPFGVELGPVPAVPLLAALPATAPPGWLAVLVLAVPVAAGALAGRRLSTPVDGWRWLPDALASGVLAGGLLGLLAAVSGGPLGSERLAVVGPSPWQTGAAVAALVGAGVVAGTAVRVRRG